MICSYMQKHIFHLSARAFAYIHIACGDVHLFKTFLFVGLYDKPVGIPAADLFAVQTAESFPGQLTRPDSCCLFAADLLSVTLLRTK